MDSITFIRLAQSPLSDGLLPVKLPLHLGEIITLQLGSHRYVIDNFAMQPKVVTVDVNGGQAIAGCALGRIRINQRWQPHEQERVVLNGRP